MKHPVFSKVISTTMALAVVLASFSFKIEQHFCGSNLVDVSVISKIESCCSVGTAKDSSLQITEQSCCSNISLVVEGFDNYQIAFVSEFTTTPYFVAIPSIQIPVDYIFETEKEFSSSTYNPPPLIFDIQVRDQVFLI
jgi:hypothetical protein